MKTLTLALLICASIPSLAQQNFTIKFGPNYNKPDGLSSDFGDALGYYIGFGVQYRIREVLGFSFDLNFLNQRAGVGDISLSVRSINANLNYLFYASDEFYFLAGLESGIVSSIKVEDETSGGDLEYRFGYVLGMAYVLNDRWDVQARAIAPFDHKQTGFDYNAQLGMVYKIKSKR